MFVHISSHLLACIHFSAPLSYVSVRYGRNVLPAIISKNDEHDEHFNDLNLIVISVLFQQVTGGGASAFTFFGDFDYLLLFNFLLIGIEA